MIALALVLNVLLPVTLLLWTLWRVKAGRPAAGALLLASVLLILDIYEADLKFPIILSPTGVVLDGMHRLCKAFLEGIEEVDAVQLPAMPPHLWRLLPTGEEVAFAEQAHD